MYMMHLLFRLIFISFLLSACESSVRLEPVKPASDSMLLSNSEIFGSVDGAEHKHDHSHTGPAADPEAEGLHRVRILETQQTKKYVYARVEEDGREYWLATNLKTLKEGNWYYFSGGYVMKDFPSREFKRVFPELMMVDNLVPEDHGGAQKLVKP